MSDLKNWKQRVSVAARRIGPYIVHTPIISSQRMSEETGHQVWLKCEQLQPTGAFKIRGAANALLARNSEERRKGTITYSTGNHGLAVAYMAQQLGIPAIICISSRVPANKVEVLKATGARVVIEGNSQDDAKEVAEDIARKDRLIMIEPFDDLDVIAGQGTVGLEILEQLPEATTVLAPLSGGGLLSGLSVFIKANRPDIRVIGVSMNQGAIMYESIRAGQPVQMPEVPTLADSLQGGIGINNRFTFSMVREYVDDIILVKEEEIGRAMALLGREGLIVEGAGAVAVAALSHHLRLRGSIVAILTGRNISLSTFCGIIKDY
jgi:threonine dehydratase